jgi:hypothetical protein
MTILKPKNSEETMNRRYIADEQGFILIWALLLMVVVTLLGVSGVSTSIFETKMAANQALHTQAFYQADGGTEVGLGLLGQNINCINGFTSTSFPTAGGDNGITLTGDVNFWVNNFNTDGIAAASDANRDLYYPNDGPAPHTNVRINGLTDRNVGSSQIGLAGYESLGTNIAQGGAGLVFQINAQYAGERNTESAICTKYRVDSQFANSPAGACNY